MTQITAERVHEAFVSAVGAEDFEPEKSAVLALSQCLFPDSPRPKVVSPTDVSQEQRLAVEQCIQQLVLSLGCEAEASQQRALDHVDPLSAPHPVLPRLFDMVLSLGDAHLLEPGIIFTLIERLVEMTFDPEECHALIDWILRNKGTLKHPHIFERGKLILLRTVNRMLKILQRGEDHAYHAGRLLFFMSELYPMAERSATNHSGLRDQSHPVKIQQWNGPLHDDFGHPIEKADYDLYWRTVEHIQRTPASESDVMRALDLAQRLLDFFKSHPCHREDSPHLARTNVALVNDTTPEQFGDIIRDPDQRMECVVQMYFFVQRLLAASKNPVVTTDAARERLAQMLSDLEHYAKGDHDLRQRWGPIHEVLVQEPRWIEWKNDGAGDWTLPPVAEHPWMDPFRGEMDELEISQILACLKEDDVDAAMDVPAEDDASWDMKVSEGLHIDFDRDLGQPDLAELHVPTAKEFLEGAAIGGEEEDDEAAMDLVESDNAFCWRTYRLLSELDIQHMNEGERRTTKFRDLLHSTKLHCDLDERRSV